MTQSPTGGPAQTIHQVTSRQGVIGRDAQRVIIVTDGRPAEGGPQQAAYFVSDAEIAAGDFIVTGNKPIPIVTVGAAGAEYPPIAVYDVTGKADDMQPAQPSTDPIGDVLRADAVAYWKMEESSGTRSDATTHGHDLLELGTVSFVAGKIGNAAGDFTRADPNGLRIGNDGSFQSFGKTFACALWFKLNTKIGPSSEDQTFIYRFGFGNPFSGIDYYIYYNSGADKFAIDCYDDQQNEYGFTDHTTIPSTGVWYFIYAYVDNANQQVGLSINTNLITADFFFSPTVPGGPYNNSTFSVGAESSVLTPDLREFQCEGDIDEVGFWDRVLTTDEIIYLYNSGAGRALFPAP